MKKTKIVLVSAFMLLAFFAFSSAAKAGDSVDPVRVFPDGTTTHWTTPPGFEITCECGGVIEVDVYYWNGGDGALVTVSLEYGDGSSEGSYDDNLVAGATINGGSNPSNVWVPNANVHNENDLDPNGGSPHADVTITFPVPVNTKVYYRVHAHKCRCGAANMYFSVSPCPTPSAPESPLALPLIASLGTSGYLLLKRRFRKRRD